MFILTLAYVLIDNFCPCLVQEVDKTGKNTLQPQSDHQDQDLGPELQISQDTPLEECKF